MASAGGVGITTIDLVVNCGCGKSRTYKNVKRGEHKSVVCVNCETSHDLSLYHHCYQHGLTSHDELVLIGSAEATRECKGCKKCPNT